MTAFEITVGAWRFAPSVVALLALAAVVGVTLHTAWRAARRLSHGSALRRWGVIVLNLIAGSAVALLLVPPGVTRDADATVTLITEGANADAAEASGPGGQRFVLDSRAGMTAADAEGELLTTAGQLLLRRPDLDAMTVLGHGLDAGSWRTLPADLAVRFEPPPLIGPVQVQWTPRLALGQALTVSGVLRLEAPEQVARLELVDPAGLVAATTSAGAGQPFSLTTTPRGAGALDYQLRVSRGESVRFSEPVGVSVVAERGARLLVIQSAPSFETRRLANWAADTGHALVIHSRISRDRDLVQGINVDSEAPLERTASLYAETDLVLMDGRRWAGLPGGARETLLDAVRSGLGLVLLADQDLAAWLDTPAHASLLGLDLAPTPVGEPVWPRWPGLDPEQPLPLAPFRLEPAGARALTRGEDGMLLEAWQPLGEGRVMVSLLRERHRWATSGEASTFARYWARLLRQVAREDAQPRWFTPPADIRPRPGQRLTLCANLDEATLSLERRGADTVSPPVALVPHATGASVRCAVTWPKEPGWHVARLLDPAGTLRDELFLRVYGPEQWSSDRHAGRQAATRARASLSPMEGDERRRVETPLSPWWAWSLLLLSAGALWLERRLHDLN